MGLDGVELILAVEETFHIDISDEEASAVATVGDLHELVVAKLAGQDSKRCLTSEAFYRTRRAIVDVMQAERRGIKPSTSLDAILPREGRRAAWQRVAGATTLKLPDLEHPGGDATLPVLAMGFGGVLGLSIGFGIWGVLLFSLAGLTAGAMVARQTRPPAVEFPNGTATVGDLAREVLTLNYGLFVEEVGGWNKAEIWETLRRVVVNQTGVDREQVTPEALIVDDLGID